MGKKIVKIKKDIHYVSENEVERLMQKLMSLKHQDSWL